jgi:indolepyruvate ferredoxin oxidoreductase, beta subunit
MAKIDIFIVGVGGQGSLSASWFLGEAAVASGLNVVVGEVHGMAQRGGIVESTVRIGDVYGPIISDQGADVLFGFEPIETLRSLGKASRKTLVVTNTHAIVPATVSLYGAAYPSLDMVFEKIRAQCERVIAFDATEMAAKAGSAKAINAAMLGALAATGVVPIPSEAIREALLSHVPKKTLDLNNRAFDAGMAFVRESGL